LRYTIVWGNWFFDYIYNRLYVGVIYDITDYIRFDRENVLVVRVDATQYEGWFYEGAGIYRHVWLNRFNDTHIANDGIFIHTKTEGRRSTINIQTTVANKGALTSNAEVITYLTDRQGRRVGKETKARIALGMNEEKKILQSIQLSDARKWSVDDPYLYRAVVEV